MEERSDDDHSVVVKEVLGALNDLVLALQDRVDLCAAEEEPLDLLADRPRIDVLGQLDEHSRQQLGAWGWRWLAPARLLGQGADDILRHRLDHRLRLGIDLEMQVGEAGQEVGLLHNLCHDPLLNSCAACVAKDCSCALESSARCCTRTGPSTGEAGGDRGVAAGGA